MRKIVVCLDGYSSCGKSTMAKDLAHEIGYIYVDTGAMYRSVTLFALRNGLFGEDGSVKAEELEQKIKDIDISFRLNDKTGKPDTSQRRECGTRDTHSRSVITRESHRRTAVCPQETCCPTTENGQREGHRDGRTRHRYGRFSGCRT